MGSVGLTPNSGSASAIVAWAVGAALACTGTVLCYGYTFSARTLGLRKAKAIFKAMLLIIVALGFVLLMFLDRMR